MANEGRRVSIHRPDKGGGFMSAGKPTLKITAITLANPGVITIAFDAATVTHHSPRLATTGSPWLGCRIRGVTGADAEDVNGTRVLTRVSDTTASIAVDTLGLSLVLTGAQVVGADVEEQDANVPKRDSYDFSLA